MVYGPLSLSRRHVLGDLYARCEAIVNVPVYLNDNTGEMLGYADEGLGHYADAFCFHLPEDICKKLSAGHFTYSFDFDLTGDTKLSASRRSIKLNYIVLTARKGYTKPEPKVRAAKVAAEASVEEPVVVE